MILWSCGIGTLSRILVKRLEKRLEEERLKGQGLKVQRHKKK